MSMTASDLTRETEVKIYAARQWRKKFSDTGQITFESVHRTKQGAYIPVEINSFLFEMDGQPMIVSVARDITERKQAEKAILRSLKEKDILLQEIHHRVKNNMQVIISLMNLQAGRIDDERLKTALLESTSRIYAMSAVHETLHQSEILSSIDLGKYLSKLSETIFNTYKMDTGRVRIRIKIPKIEVSLEKSYPIGLISNEILSNSLKYAFPDGGAGEIAISGEFVDNSVRLTFADTGVGLPVDFDWRNTDSLGLGIIRALIEEQLGGTIDLDLAHGTRWTITFPVAGMND